MKKMVRITATLGMLLVFASGCFVWNVIKDRYTPFVFFEEFKDGGRKVKFVFDSPASQSVALAGQFNNWVKPGDSVSANENKNIVLLMERNKETGFWERFMYLAPGKYQYKYVLDSGTWQYDQNTLEKTDDGFGSFNSIIVVP
jgi:1,4-alpha-glucan branching enzyme